MIPRPPDRSFDLVRPAIFALIDMVALEAAFLGTFWLRFHSGWFLVPLGVPSLHIYTLTSFGLLVVWAGIFHAQGLYDSSRRKRIDEDVYGLVKGVILGSLLVLAVAFFFRGISYSRSFFGLFFLTSLLLLTMGRVLARAVLRAYYRRGVGITRVLLVGNSQARLRILETFHRMPGLGFTTVGCISLPGEPEPVPDPDHEYLVPPSLGGIDDLEAVVEEHAVDQVLLTLPFHQLVLLGELADRLGPQHVDVQFVPDLAELKISRMRSHDIAGIPLLGVRESGLSGFDRIVKRTLDVVLTGVGLVVLSPVLLLLALLVRLSSPGSILYRQERLGRDNRPFDMLKFRTMREDAEAGSGPVWTVEDDPRKTMIGSFLRRFSLDELPQLWNVLVGDMSLVGPRPERAHFAQQFQTDVPRYLERHRVRSGLTGWAQVNGLRGNTPIELRTIYDLHYVENWSLGLDLRILLRTVIHVIRGDNAY